MTERWPDLAGRIEGKVHVLPIRVYYEDTDFSGAVYHANYLKFCERARSDCLRLIGIHHSELHGTASFVVRRMVCDFLKPALIDNLLEVETRFGEFGGARMELNQCVKRSGEALFEAEVPVVLVDGKGRPKRLPAEMTKTFLSLVESNK
ncbi:MAG: tol-pal system-associated acyl-CoA thioesterase [Burkholderiales bacterium]